MSRHPSPGLSHPHVLPVFQQAPPPTMPLPPRQKSKAYATGIAAGAEDVKYQTKYKELKRKVKEIEADNDKLHFKVLQTKRSIQRMKLEQAVLYERLSAVPPSPDSQDRHGFPPMHAGSGIQPHQPPPNLHSHAHSHLQQPHPQHNHNHHNQHLPHREHAHAHPHSHPHSTHTSSQGDPNDFIDFMRAQHHLNNNNVGGNGGLVMPSTDSRPIPISEIGPPLHPSRSNSAGGGNGSTVPVSTSHDSSLQLPPLPQHIDQARAHMHGQDRGRTTAVPVRGHPDGVYGALGPQQQQQQQQQQQPYAPDALPPMQHVMQGPSLTGTRDRARRHDLHELAGEYTPAPAHGGGGGGGAPGGGVRGHHHQRVSYMGRGDEHGPPMHGHGHASEWERGGREREYAPTMGRVDTPPVGGSGGVSYRRGEHVEQHAEGGVQHRSRSVTPGAVDGPSRVELVYERGRFGGSQGRDESGEGEEARRSPPVTSEMIERRKRKRSGSLVDDVVLLSEEGDSVNRMT